MSDPRSSDQPNSINSRRWTGDLSAATGTPTKQPSRSISRLQIVLFAILAAVGTGFAWLQVYHFLADGTLEVRYGGLTTFQERPFRFLFAALIWFGWAGFSAWVAFKLATKRGAWRELMMRMSRAWREAPWIIPRSTRKRKTVTNRSTKGRS